MTRGCRKGEIGRSKSWLRDALASGWWPSSQAPGSDSSSRLGWFSSSKGVTGPK
jgi:hypothetical protein